VWLFAGQGRLLLVLAVLALMGTAAWMAALTGWPSRPTDPGRRPRGLRFVLSSTVLGALLVFLLVKLGLPTYVVAFLTGAVAVGLLGGPVSLAPKALLAEPGFDAAAAAAMLRTVKAQEDHEVQNHMAVLAIVDAPWRRVTLKAFLYTLNYLFYRSVLPDLWGGKLFGLSTVHCAQWVLLEDGRFLFLSNYDHTWNTYLNDFGAHLRSGIQKIWGQCRDNPGTGDLEAFKRYVRRSMVPYAVWYRAYPDMTVRQVWNTEHLRAALDRDLPEEKVIKSLRRLGAAPKVLPEISHAAQ
jgi:hypothetical protein